MLRFVLAFPDDADLRAKRAHRLHLVSRHERRHADRRFDAERTRGMRDGAAMIAGRRGHDLPAALLRQRGECIGGAAQLEAASRLHRFELQEDRCVGHRRQCRRFDQRRAAHAPFESAARTVDIGERKIGHGVGMDFNATQSNVLKIDFYCPSSFRVHDVPAPCDHLRDLRRNRALADIARRPRASFRAPFYRLLH